MNSQIDITEDQITEQVNLERSQIKQGLKRLRDQTYKLEAQQYSSATVYGIASIDALLPRVVQRIEDTNKKIHQGKYGAAFKDIHQYLASIEALAAAAIACKVTFDNVFGYKDNCNTATNVCSMIGKAIEDECQMRHYEHAAPALLKTLKDNYWHKACGTQQKLVVIRTLMNRYRIEQWIPWGTSIRTKLGGWLLDCIMASSGWFYKQRIRTARCSSDASRLWIRLGAVAALCLLMSTSFPSSTATDKSQRPKSCSCIRSTFFLKYRCLTTKPEGVVHSTYSSPRLIVLPTSDSIHLITDIGPGTTAPIAERTDVTI